MKTFCAAIEEYVVEPRSMKFHGKVISPGTKEHWKMLKQIRRHLLAGREPVFFRGWINRRGKGVLKMIDRFYGDRRFVSWAWK